MLFHVVISFYYTWYLVSIKIHSLALVMVFSNWSIWVQVGRIVPLSLYSSALTSFMRLLCLVTTVRTKDNRYLNLALRVKPPYVGLKKPLERKNKHYWRIMKDEVFTSFKDFSAALGCMYPPDPSRYVWWCHYLALDQIFSLKWSLRFLPSQLCLTWFQPSHPQFWFVCFISGYRSNIWAQRISGPSEGRWHQNNEDSHQKW